MKSFLKGGQAGFACPKPSRQSKAIMPNTNVVINVTIETIVCIFDYVSCCLLIIIDFFSYSVRPCISAPFD